MLAGELMNAGGISQRIVAFALAWVGHIRGGLGLVAIFALGADGRDLGSAAADTAAHRHAADPDDARRPATTCRARPD